MSRNLSASDRTSLIRLASSLLKGSSERREVLSILKWSNSTVPNLKAFLNLIKSPYKDYAQPLPELFEKADSYFQDYKALLGSYRFGAFAKNFPTQGKNLEVEFVRSVSKGGSSGSLGSALFWYIRVGDPAYIQKADFGNTVKTNPIYLEVLSLPVFAEEYGLDEGLIRGILRIQKEMEPFWEESVQAHAVLLQKQRNEAAEKQKQLVADRLRGKMGDIPEEFWPLAIQVKGADYMSAYSDDARDLSRGESSVEKAGQALRKAPKDVQNKILSWANLEEYRTRLLNR